MRHNESVIVALLALVALSIAPAAAQPAAGAGAKAGVESGSENKLDEEKKAAIEELMKVTNVEKRIEAIRQSVFKQAKRSFKLLAVQKIKDKPEYAEASQKEMLEAVTGQADEMSGKYNKLFDEQIDLSSVVRQVVTETYGKYFTTSEIRDLITFYKSPTGKKARLVMPKVGRESIIRTKALMKPKLSTILATVMSQKEEQAETRDAEVDKGSETKD